VDGRTLVSIYTENDIDKLTKFYFSQGWEKALEKIVLLLNDGASTDAIHNFCLDELG
jgi:hypothetical protein